MSILEDARAALATGPLCDSCLGRLFADRSFGLANAERGHALRVTVALADDDPFEAGEDCWVCENECDRFDWWAEQAASAVRGYEFDTYQVGTKVPPLLEENDELLREDIGLDPDAGEALKTELNREVGKRIGDLTGAEVEFGRPAVQLTLDLATDEVETHVNSAFIYGRYRKLERDIPQTKWPATTATGPDCGRASLRRLWRQRLPLRRERRATVRARRPRGDGRRGGRVPRRRPRGRRRRMLDSGRPFVIEVMEPRKRDVDADELEADINAFADGKVEVTDLHPATHEMVERVKELDASKTYRMDVEFGDAVDAEALQDALVELDGATIQQETPQRVTHRRADITRTRTVYDAEGELTDDRHAELRIHGEGGLYVKELVSSDEDRTEPSLAGLLDTDAVVTALDVIDVQGEDEPFAKDEFLKE